MHFRASCGEALIAIIAVLQLGVAGALADRLAPDADIKEALAGYWASPRHEYLYKTNGVCFLVGGTTVSSWDVRDGVYYQDGRPHQIVSLTPKQFVFRPKEKPNITITLERCSQKDLAVLRDYYVDWMREHE